MKVDSWDGLVYGVRSPHGDKGLRENPFIKGAEIPLATDEELFCYPTAQDLFQATRERDRGHIHIAFIGAFFLMNFVWAAVLLLSC